MKYFAFFVWMLPFMILSFIAGILSTKEIPMDGFPEKPSATYLVVSNMAQKVVAWYRPKPKEYVSFNVTITNWANSGTLILTNKVITAVWFGGTNTAITLTNWSAE